MRNAEYVKSHKLTFRLLVVAVVFYGGMETRFSSNIYGHDDMIISVEIHKASKEKKQISSSQGRTCFQIKSRQIFVSIWEET